MTNSNVNLDNFYGDNIEKIKCPFTSLQFYYINNKMAKYLKKNIGILTHQIDITIGLLSKKDIFSNNKFYNLKTNSLTTNKQFISDVQFFHLHPKYISKILNLPSEISIRIYKFIPDMYKLDTKQQLENSSFHFDMKEILWFV